MSLDWEISQQLQQQILIKHLVVELLLNEVYGVGNTILRLQNLDKDIYESANASRRYHLSSIYYEELKNAIEGDPRQTVREARRN